MAQFPYTVNFYFRCIAHKIKIKIRTSNYHKLKNHPPKGGGLNMVDRGMELVCGVRKGVLYTVKEKPLDPRWSQRDIQVYLGLCATGQSLGLSPEQASLEAEAFVFKQISLVSRKQHET